MTEQFTISQLASEFNVTPRTLRFYEEKGLLSPLRLNGARVYSTADRVRLRLILRGKGLGFSLEESREIITLYEPETGNARQIDALLCRIQEKRALLKQRKREINTMLKYLDQTETVCRDAIATAKPSRPAGANPDESRRGAEAATTPSADQGGGRP